MTPPSSLTTSFDAQMHRQRSGDPQECVATGSKPATSQATLTIGATSIVTVTRAAAVWLAAPGIVFDAATRHTTAQCSR